MNEGVHSLSLAKPVLQNDNVVLSKQALLFIEQLVKTFQPERSALLNERNLKQKHFDEGHLPNFLAQTLNIRQDQGWKIAPIPQDLLDRRVEITGSVDPKGVINALNSKANVFVACFEEATSPTWRNLIQGQMTLKQANEGTLSFVSPDTAKIYKLSNQRTVLIVKPRGLHLPEKNVLYNGEPISASLFDFGLYAFHNYQSRKAMGSGLYYCLPKLENHLEARWWNQVFHFSETYFKQATGMIRATVCIETLPAAFEMEEILYEMKERIVGMNCGRWNYIFSYIKTLREHPDRLLPDRQQVTMDKPFLNAYSRLLIRTCHRRGAIAIGGMSALIPNNNPKINDEVVEKVRQDKEREASNGHDGTWVAHPDFVNIAKQVFDSYIESGRLNQLQIAREEDFEITAADLLEPCEGDCTESGMRANIQAAIQCLAAWLDGRAHVSVDGLMENITTCEVACASIWQMIKHGAVLDSGLKVTSNLFRRYLSQEASAIKQNIGQQQWEKGKYGLAIELLDQTTTCKPMADFLMLSAYKHLAAS